MINAEIIRPDRVDKAVKAARVDKLAAADDKAKAAKVVVKVVAAANSKVVVKVVTKAIPTSNSTSFKLNNN
jgi:hypothetical protein